MEILPEAFSSFMEEALYGGEGFYTKGGGAGRSRDYLTSPEVGDLFGRVIASYIDDWYESLETDEPAIVVDAGCGPGSLAASIFRSNMRNAQMIDYFLVDRSPAHLATCDEKLGGIETDVSWSLYEKIPECVFPTLVIANELLDNLVFDIVGTHEKYHPYEPDKLSGGNDEAKAYFGLSNNIDNLLGANVPVDIDDFQVPSHIGISDWFVELSEATSEVGDLTLLLFEYMKSVTQMQDGNWLRLYSENKRIVGLTNVLLALAAGTTGDITTDVIAEDLHLILDQEGFSKVRFRTQLDWLDSQGVDTWCRELGTKSAYEQLEGWVSKDKQLDLSKSFQNERNILTNEEGLGAFTVVTAKREI